MFTSDFQGLKALVDKPESATSHVQRRQDAALAFGIHQTLTKTNFFVLYIHLYLEISPKYQELVRCLDYDPGIILESIQKYFGTKNVTYLGPKTEGSNSGLRFKLTRDNGEDETYYVKVNERTWDKNPDPREMMAYLILKWIGLGPPKCFFVPVFTGSMSVVYIVTLEV